MAPVERPIEAAYQKVLGVEPTASDVAALYRLRDALKLKDDDPIWVIFFVLQHYETLYRGIPDDIERAASGMKAVSERVEALISSAGAKTLPESRSRLRDAFLFVLAVIGISVSAVMGFHLGQRSAPKPDPQIETCFGGEGRIADVAGKRYCYPISKDNTVFGLEIGESPRLRHQR